MVCGSVAVSALELSYMHLAVPAVCGEPAERQRVSRHLASLVNTFTNYGDVKGDVLKNSERVREVTLCMSGFPGAVAPRVRLSVIKLVPQVTGCHRFRSLDLGRACIGVAADRMSNVSAHDP